MKFVNGAGVAEEKMVSTSEIDCTEWQSHRENKFTEMLSRAGGAICSFVGVKWPVMALAIDSCCDLQYHIV